MEIRETDTFVIIENAPCGFCKCVELIPLRLFWYEIIMSEGIMRVTVVPSSIESIKYFDIDEILDDLAGKADTDLTNATDQAKILMGGMAMPSGTSINLTLGASGTTYTAPANGYVYLRMIGRANNNCGFSINSSSNIGINEEVFQSGAHTGGFLPVKIGDTFTVGHWNSNVEAFIFIYAQGSESEAN